MEKERIRKILVPLDGSKNSLRGLNKAIYLAQEHEASLVFIHVIHRLPKRKEKTIPENGITQDDPTFLVTAEMLAKKNGIPSSGRVIIGDPGHAIMDYANTHGIDLIVMGARGLSVFKKIFLGSVSSYVLQKAKVAVMVVK
jgi:nucleotide-binding universal stress UspA family protein